MYEQIRRGHAPPPSKVTSGFMKLKKSHLLFLLAAASSAPSASAANGTWTTVTSGGLWNDTANWSGGTVADDSSSSANFSTLDITTDNTVRLDGPHTLNSLSFGDITIGSAAGWNLDNNGIPANSLTLGGTTPTITAGTFATGKNATIRAVVAGSAGFTKAGAGTLVLSGANTYTGATAVSEGKLVQQLPATNIITLSSTTGSVASGATLRFDLSQQPQVSGFAKANLGNTAVDGTVELYTTLVNGGNGANLLSATGSGTATVFTGAGTINKEGGGEIDFWTTTGALKNFTGPINVNSGTLNFQMANGGKTDTTGADFSGQSALTIASGATVDVRTDVLVVNTLSGAGTVTASFNSGNNFSVGNNSGTGTFAGIIKNGVGTIKLFKNGTGTQTFTGVNTFTGTTTIGAGTLEIGGAGTFGAGTYAGNIANAGTLLYSSSSNQTLSGIVSGAGALGKTGGGALTLSNATVSYAGTTTVSRGVVNVTTATAISSNAWNIGVDYGATAPSAAGVLTFTASQNLTGKTLTTVTGTGTEASTSAYAVPILALKGGNTNSPTVTAPSVPNQSIVRVGNTYFLTHSSLNSYLWNTAASASTAADGSGTWDTSTSWRTTADPVNNTGATWVGGANIANFGVANGAAGTVTVTGTVNAGGLGFNPTGSGTYTISGGTVAFGANNGILSTNGTDATVTSILTGTAGATKQGAGTLILTGANSYTNGTAVNGGVLQIGNGTVNGTVGSGNYVIASGATLYLNQGASPVSPTWSRFTGAGTMRLGDASAGNVNFSTLALGAGFTGTLQMDNRDRINGTPANLGNTTTVILNSGAQFLAFDGTANGTTYTYPQNFSIAGVGSEGTQNFGALRASQLAAIFSGNITLTGNSGLYVQRNTNSSMTVSGPISGGFNLSLYNAQGPTGGLLTLSGANSYTGTTTFTTGITAVNTLANGGVACSIGASSNAAANLVFGGGTMKYTGATTSTDRAFTVSAASNLEVTNAGTTLTIANTVAASGGSLVLTKTGAGTLVLGGTADNSSMFLSVSTGEVDLAKSVASVRAVAGINSVASGALVKLTGTGGDQIFDGSAVANMGVNGLAGTLDLNGNSETTSHFAGAATGLVTNSASSTNVTWTVGNTNATGDTFAGVIQNGKGTVAVTKIGNGTQTLSGANTYSGTTAVNAGTLLVTNTSGSGTGSGPASVAAAGTLGGNGTVGGTVAVAGKISPGSNGTGTLTTGALTLTGTYQCELDGATCDKLAVGGSLTLSNATLAVSKIAALTANSYVIATYTGTAPSFTTVTGVPVGYSLDLATAGQIKLVGSPLYHAWLVANSKTPSADNLKEYAFGTTNSGAIIVNSPTSITLGQGPAMQINGTDVSALFVRRQDYLTGGLAYKVRFSADLTTWYDSTDTANLMYAGTPDLNNPAVAASQGGLDAVSIPFPLFIKTANGFEKVQSSFMAIEVTTP